MAEETKKVCNLPITASTSVVSVPDGIYFYDEDMNPLTFEELKPGHMVITEDRRCICKYQTDALFIINATTKECGAKVIEILPLGNSGHYVNVFKYNRQTKSFEMVAEKTTPMGWAREYGTIGDIVKFIPVHDDFGNDAMPILSAYDLADPTGIFIVAPGVVRFMRNYLEWFADKCCENCDEDEENDIPDDVTIPAPEENKPVDVLEEEKEDEIEAIDRDDIEQLNEMREDSFFNQFAGPLTLYPMSIFTSIVSRLGTALEDAHEIVTKINNGEDPDESHKK